jgi:ASC-1-like (ASCH) protein
MEIRKKVQKQYFQKILEGKKNFELRLADFECNPGDILVLDEWDEEIQSYTGRTLNKTVSYVLKTKDINFWKQEDVEKYGFQIISF